MSADIREKIYTIGVPELGSEAGKVIIDRKSLYGLKIYRASFIAMLDETVWGLGYRPTKADPDTWIFPALKPCGTKYYEMFLCYVDDIISIYNKTMEEIEGIQKVFKLKGYKAEVPDMFLHGGISLLERLSGTKCWTISSEKYFRT